MLCPTLDDIAFVGPWPFPGAGDVEGGAPLQALQPVLGFLAGKEACGGGPQQDGLWSAAGFGEEPPSRVVHDCEALHLSPGGALARGWPNAERTLPGVARPGSRGAEAGAGARRMDARGSLAGGVAP